MRSPFTPVLLTEAVDKADWTVVFEARRQGITWHALRSSHGMPALARAVIDNDLLVVQRLLEREAPVTACYLNDGSWSSPLWTALERGQEAMVRALLQAGADPNLGPPDGWSPLQMAASMALADATLDLLAHGASPAQATPALALWTSKPIPGEDEGVLKAVAALIDQGADLPQHWVAWVDTGCQQARPEQAAAWETLRRAGEADILDSILPAGHDTGHANVRI